MTVKELYETLESYVSSIGDYPVCVDNGNEIEDIDLVYDCVFLYAEGE